MRPKASLADHRVAARTVWSITGLVLVSVTFIGSPADSGSPPTIAAAMTAVRERHATDGLGGSAAGSAPLMTSNGFVAETGLPSPTLLLGVRDAAGFKAYADAAAGVDVSPADTAMIGSQTKTFTAAAILQLDQEGRLSIKESLADPKWADVVRWPNGEAITLEMLLSQTSGIPDFTTTKAFQQGMSDPAWAPTPADLLDLARTAEPTFAPGDGWSYSNTGYILLGVIIEKVTGKSYASELEDRFFGPLGLSDTHLYSGSTVAPTMPSYVISCAVEPEPGSGEDNSPPTGKSDGPPPCPAGKAKWLPMAKPFDHVWPIIWAAGGVQSSTRDMSQWITDLVIGDDVLDADHRRLMQTPVPQSRDGIARQFPSLAGTMTGYGLGLCIFTYDIGTGFGHAGNIPGYASNSVYFPGHGNDFALTVVAGDTEADVVAAGMNLLATAVRAQR